MERGSRESFTRMGTLGIEEECFVVDADGRPTSGTDELVYEHDPPEILEGRLDHELFKFVIETQTPLIESPDDARDSLLAIREALVEHAENHGYRIAAAGLHPLAKWQELEHAEKPRYRSQLDRIQYPQHRNTTAGVHVHVGVDDADKAVWIANELRWYVPIMLALSANSPYWNGFDTGLQSARAKIFEALPNTGMPTHFEDFEAFDRFERLMLETESINDRGELWYDVRPHTAHGTVELRTPDGQADPEIVLAFVEYAHTHSSGPSPRTTKMARAVTGTAGNCSMRTSGGPSATGRMPLSSTATSREPSIWENSSTASASASASTASETFTSGRAARIGNAVCSRRRDPTRYANRLFCKPSDYPQRFNSARGLVLYENPHELR